MILYRKAGLRFAETWFDENCFAETGFDQARLDRASSDEAGSGKAVADKAPFENIRPKTTRFGQALPPGATDVLRCVQRSEPMATGMCEPFHTIVIDLHKRPDQLLGEMNRETRYEIRRALDKDGLTYEIWRPTNADRRREFRSFYDNLASGKGLLQLNYRKIEKFAAAGAFVLSLAQHGDGRPLVWHSYYEGEGRVRLLHSATSSAAADSADRSLLGRANRFLHWQDMSAFQARGLQTYDLGGWYAGQEDRKKIGINRFKQGFGGQIVVNYNCLTGLTRLGSAAVWFYSMRCRKGQSRLPAVS